MSFTKKTASSHVLSCNSVNNNTIYVRGTALYAEGSPTPYNAAEIQGVGNKVSKNILPYPYQTATKTANGVTYTNNRDGSISVSGIATGYSDFFFGHTPITPNTMFTFSKNQSDDAANIVFVLQQLDENKTYVGEAISILPSVMTYTITTAENARYIRVACKRSENNIECKGVYRPMIEIGNTVTKYAPYGEEIKYEIPIKISGKNLIPYPYANTTKTQNGLTFTDNGDGSITVNGTATAEKTFFTCTVASKYPLEKGKYMLSGCPEGGGASTYRIYLEFYKDTTWKHSISDTGSGKSVDCSTIDYTGAGIGIVIAKDTICENLVFRPMLAELSSDSAGSQEYEPYYESVEKIITPSHPLYGRDGNFDNVNFKSGKALRNVFYKELTGNEKWQASDKYINTYYATDLMNKRAPYGYRYCSHYKEVLAPDIEVDREEKVTGIAWDAIPLLIRDDNRKTVDEFKAFLKEQKDVGNPVTLVVTAANFDKPYTENVEMPTLPTIDGTTNIKIDTKIVPENVDISFYQYQDEDGE